MRGRRKLEVETGEKKEKEREDHARLAVHCRSSLVCTFAVCEPKSCGCGTVIISRNQSLVHFFSLPSFFPFCSFLYFSFCLRFLSLLRSLVGCMCAIKKTNNTDNLFATKYALSIVPWWITSNWNKLQHKKKKLNAKKEKINKQSEMQL